MKQRSKRIAAGLLALAAALSLVACGGGTAQPADTTKAASQAPQTASAPAQSAGEKPAESAGGTMTLADFYADIETCVQNGDQFSDLLMNESADAHYSFAAASLSSMRLAVERILWLRGEGEDFASLAQGSRYTDWDEIAEICYASPYPYYFEGLIHEIQGEETEATEDYAAAVILPNFPEKGLDFWYLRDLPIEELYSLRDTLRQKEKELYAFFWPDLHGLARSPSNGLPDYMRDRSLELMEEERYAEALIAARHAVHCGTLDAKNWTCAIVAALYADEPYQASRWLDEALCYFPEHEGLNELRDVLRQLAQEAESGVN